MIVFANFLILEVALFTTFNTILMDSVSRLQLRMAVQEFGIFGPTKCYVIILVESDLRSNACLH